MNDSADHAGGSPQKALRLPLVLKEHQLSTNLPAAFERAVRACAVGDGRHRAVLHTAQLISAQALQQCLPPSPRSEITVRLSTVRDFCQGQGSLGAVRRARAEVFEFVGVAERTTLATVAKAAQLSESTLLERQAAITVRRYVARSVHHAVACALMTLDAVLRPLEALPVREEAAGAIAFQRVGLGAARSPELQRFALERAAWEAQHLSLDEQPEQALALQLFHEYLGGQWKDHATAQRAYFDEFIAWAFDTERGGAPPSGGG